MQIIIKILIILKFIKFSSVGKIYSLMKSFLTIFETDTCNNNFRNTIRNTYTFNSVSDA